MNTEIKEGLVKVVKHYEAELLAGGGDPEERNIACDRYLKALDRYNKFEELEHDEQQYNSKIELERNKTKTAEKEHKKEFILGCVGTLAAPVVMELLRFGCRMVAYRTTTVFETNGVPTFSATKNAGRNLLDV